MTRDFEILTDLDENMAENKKMFDEYTMNQRMRRSNERERDESEFKPASYNKHIMHRLPEFFRRHRCGREGNHDGDDSESAKSLSQSL